MHGRTTIKKKKVISLFIFRLSDVNLCDITHDMSEIYLGHSVLEFSCTPAFPAHLECCAVYVCSWFLPFQNNILVLCSRVVWPKKTAGPFKAVPICCPEIQVTSCHPLPCNIPAVDAWSLTQLCSSSDAVGCYLDSFICLCAGGNDYWLIPSCAIQTLQFEL
jgi:hypothetical protein